MADDAPRRLKRERPATDDASSDPDPTAVAPTNDVTAAGTETVDDIATDPIATVQALFPGRVVAVETEPEPVEDDPEAPPLDELLDPEDADEGSGEADDERPDTSG